MKKILISFFILVFLCLTPLALFNIDKMIKMGMHNCPISVLMGNGCIGEMSKATILVKHLETFQNSTQTLTGQVFVLATILFVVVFLLGGLERDITKYFKWFKSKYKFGEIYYKTFKKRLHWLSLHNKVGDSLVFYLAY